MRPLVLGTLALALTACGSKTMTDLPASQPSPVPGAPVATFGAGCFWCVEAVFERIEGVTGVESGYMGGHVADPTYRQVCEKDTGHAEVVQVTFDPDRVSFDVLLAWFWRLHDPTTLHRQGADEGPQYRSAIFYHSEEQRRLAEAARAERDASGEFDAPIVTEISAASTLYTAEGYHQDYYELNKSQPYCRLVIAPKLDKLGLDE
ncbi:MAG: peptide-methionine (S)-S-oxide reductase [Planctomycetes bacterium]|jgi:peptide-methionine (S)-S-oxide reductase|nr:peptide-methionine (S)-S-oxide reductase [Planctomycetota bacterium]MDP6409951.1 peptide-methionine (S)-S-oxide reductase MsrA [Planctomycetota bacterium]